MARRQVTTADGVLWQPARYGRWLGRSGGVRGVLGGARAVLDRVDVPAMHPRGLGGHFPGCHNWA